MLLTILFTQNDYSQILDAFSVPCSFAAGKRLIKSRFQNTANCNALLSRLSYFFGLIIVSYKKITYLRYLLLFFRWGLVQGGILYLRSLSTLTRFFWLFWPLTPLRWHFLPYKSWQKFNIFGLPTSDLPTLSCQCS